MHTVMTAYGNKVRMPDVVHPDPFLSDWPDPDLTEELQHTGQDRDHAHRHDGLRERGKDARRSASGSVFVRSAGSGSY